MRAERHQRHLYGRRRPGSVARRRGEGRAPEPWVRLTESCRRPRCGAGAALAGEASRGGQAPVVRVGVTDHYRGPAGQDDAPCGRDHPQRLAVSAVDAQGLAAVLGGERPPVGQLAGAIPSRRLRVNHSASRCEGGPMRMNRSRSGSGGISMAMAKRLARAACATAGWPGSRACHGRGPGGRHDRGGALPLWCNQCTALGV
jgi:hypothetical protein